MQGSYFTVCLLRCLLLVHLQAVQGRLLGLSADFTERLCALVKHEAREEYGCVVCVLVVCVLVMCVC